MISSSSSTGRRGFLEPVREPLVQLGPRLLRERRGRPRRGSGRAGSGTRPREKKVARAGSIRSLRTSVIRWRRRRPVRIGREVREAVRQNSLPITDARSITARSSGASRSSRAASSAWIVGGIARSAEACRSRCSMASISSTNSGLPSAGRGSARAPRRPSRLAAERCRRSVVRLRRPRAARAGSIVAFGRCRRPSGARVEQLGPCDAERGAAARRAPSRRGAR